MEHALATFQEKYAYFVKEVGLGDGYVSGLTVIMCRLGEWNLCSSLSLKQMMSARVFRSVDVG